jgi:hypothetical protein
VRHGPPGAPLPADEYGHHPVWSCDGRQLFYTPGPGPFIISVPVTTGAAFSMGEAKTLKRQFTNAPPQIGRTYDVAADSRFLGVASSQFREDNTVVIVLNWFEELQSRVK